MRSSRKQRFRFGIAVLLVPPAVWAFLVALAPTEWARSRVETAIADSIRQPVRLGGLRFGFLGGVRLLDLQFGEPAVSDGPWLSAREVRVDLSPLQLMAGRIEPTGASATGVDLRLLRRADGSMEFGGLPEPTARLEGDPSKAEDTRLAASPLLLELAESRLRVVDVPTGTDLVLEAVEGTATWHAKALEIERLAGRTRDGTIALAARIERGGPRPAIEGQLRVRGVELGKGLGALSRIVPALADAEGSVEGSLDLDLLLITQGDSADALLDGLKGRGRVAVKDLSPTDSAVLKAASEAFHLPSRGRLGSISGEFLVESRRVESRSLTLGVGSLPVRLSGWTDFDGVLDYRLQLDGLFERVEQVADRLPVGARGRLDDLRKAVGRADLVRLRGRAGEYVLTADGRRIDAWVRRASGAPEAPPTALGHRFDGDARRR